MTHWLLLLLFAITLVGDMLGLNAGLAPGLSVKNAFLYLASIAIAIEAAVTRNRHLELLTVVVPFLLCIAYAVFTWIVIILVIDYPGYRILQGAVSLKGSLVDHILVFLIFFYGITSIQRAIWLFRAMVWLVIVVNLVSVVDHLNIPDLGLLEYLQDDRLGGPIGESNQYAAFLSLFIPLNIALVVTEHGIRRHLALVGAFISLVALFLTGSRGGMAGLLGSGVLGALYLRHLISPRLVVSGAGVLVALTFGTVAVLYSTGYWEPIYLRFVDESVRGDAFAISSGRTYIWATALAKMLDQPVTLITGFGWDAYKQVGDFRFAPHNSYLKIYFELGAIGLLLIVTAFANLVRVSRASILEAKSDQRAMLAGFLFGFVAVLLATFFVDLSSPWLLIWAFAGIASRVAVCELDSPLSNGSALSRTRGGERIGEGSAA